MIFFFNLLSSTSALSLCRIGVVEEWKEAGVLVDLKDDGVLVDWNGVLCARSGVGRLGDGSIELSINVFTRELVLKNFFLDFSDYFFWKCPIQLFKK